MLSDKKLEHTKYPTYKLLSKSQLFETKNRHHYVSEV